MPQEQQAETNPQRESPAETLSFRERTAQRLSAERQGGEPEGPPPGYEEESQANLSTEDEGSDKVGEGYEEAIDPARETEAGETEELETKPTEEQAETEEAVTETSEDEESTDPEYGTVQFERLRADEADERARSMERDYRVKTHRIAAAVRDVEKMGEVVKEQSQFIANMAEQGVQQFAGVDWDVLRTDPKRFQEATGAYNSALQQRDTFKRNLEQIAVQNDQRVEDMKARESEVSRDILKTTVPDWSNELYGKLRTFAIEDLAYTAEEFDDMTDWRRVRDVHAQYQIAQAPRKIARLTRKKGKQPAQRQREQATGRQARSASGQFQSSRQNLWDNPGDKGARRSYFQDKMRAERERRL